MIEELDVMSKSRKNRILQISGFVLIAALAFFLNQYKSPTENETSTNTLKSGVIEVHFIDVGQGDSILIEAEDSKMLIDAGENNKGSTVVEYLKSKNITNLDYVIGTHPHSDHIGGLDMVLKTFSVDTMIMPDVVHTTRTFEDLLATLEKTNLKLTKAVAGDQYNLGPATFTILAPSSSSYEDLNNYSIVIKLTYGDTSFLLTGDAGVLSEKEMLTRGIDLSADVLKLGHHGSAYSSSANFLDAVNPTYAVVSVGKDNDYGHPHVETLQAMYDRNIKLYRTDTQGTIVFTSDGKNISVNTIDYTITDHDLER